ncbi:MAG: ABC transporter permease [Proteobacteria bacterium]|nr:ABC transporter permease [Pseudomonadota bacterium]
MDHQDGEPIAPREFGAVNWLGLWTLYAKEVQRFCKIWLQTIAAPAMISLLFLAVFSLVLGRAGRDVGGVPFVEFLAPGLIMMSIIQNSFQNATSTLMISKMQGNIVDVLMPPLSSAELMLGFALGGATRGIIVAIVAGIALYIFVPFSLASVWPIVVFAVLAAMALSVMGVIVGIWAYKFDDIATITNFIVTPLAFLSGTFYSVERLPPFFHTLSQINPIFYMIDGFRSGFIGQSDASATVALVVLISLNAVLWTICYFLFAKGFKLKT